MTVRPLLLACACFVAPLGAQRVETGFLNRQISVAGHSYRYQVFVPADYAAKNSWPVILFLHGAGERGSDGMAQVTVGLGAAIRRDPSRFPAIVVMPQAPDDSQWVGVIGDMAYQSLVATLREFHVDQERIYLTGLSMGGHGSWYLAYRHPGLFAAVVPISGWVGEMPGFKGSVPIVPAESGAALPALARQLARVPLWIFHGEMDGVVPVNGSREPAASLTSAAGDVRYTEFLGLGHNAWDAAYASDSLVHWLFAQRRKRQ